MTFMDHPVTQQIAISVPTSWRQGLVVQIKIVIEKFREKLRELVPKGGPQDACELGRVTLQ
jgi:hypothetical protein